jgi:DNA ligase 1
MSKRPLSSSPATPRKRKGLVKDSGSQQSLDSFFMPRTVTASLKKSVSDSTSLLDCSGPLSVTVSSGSGTRNLAADEALARRLAAEDSADEHMYRRMEHSAGKFASSSKSPTKASPEIIDVDLLEDPITYPVLTSKPAQPFLQVSLEASQVSVQSGTANRASSSQKHRLMARTVVITGTEADTSVQYPALDMDPVVYSLDTCPWRENSAAPYAFLAHTLATLSGTRSRITIMHVLTNALRTIIKYHPASLRPALYLLSNSLSPPYSPTELGLGPSIVSKAIQDVSGLTSSALRRLYNTTGDPGELESCPLLLWRFDIDFRGCRVRGKV